MTRLRGHMGVIVFGALSFGCSGEIEGGALPAGSPSAGAHGASAPAGNGGTGSVLDQGGMNPLATGGASGAEVGVGGAAGSAAYGSDNPAGGSGNDGPANSSGGDGSGGDGSGGDGSGGDGSGGGMGGTPSGSGGAGTGGGGTSGAATEPPPLTGITAAHNDARNAVGSSALTWSSALADVALAWAQTCTDSNGDGLLDHSGNRYGENIYASTGATNGLNAVAAWVAEKNDYTYSSNSCTPMRACGHYTQVVWSSTQRVGCAYYHCSSLRYGHAIICNYDPPGNYIGQRPY